MIQHHFAYRDPRDLGEALECLAAAGDDVAVLGGGTWLIPNMTFTAVRPAVVLDPKHLGLERITREQGLIVVGARATYVDVLRDPIIRSELPLLAKMADQITGGRSIVGQGTIGGSACYANPSSDVPACLVALRARMRLASQKGFREVEAASFFRDAFETARRPDEMLTGIAFPAMPSPHAYGYTKLKLSTGSWPIVTSAVVAEARPSGVDIRLVIGAVTPVPILAELSLPLRPSRQDLEALSSELGKIAPETELSDELAGPGYRRRVTHAVILRSLLQCGLAS